MDNSKPMLREFDLERLSLIGPVSFQPFFKERIDHGDNYKGNHGRA
jgi:hypothetical protein